jgi:hypothetical protein
MKYRNRIPEPETTISGFADNKKKINPDRPTLDFFDMWQYTHIYLFWPKLALRAIYDWSMVKLNQ